MALAGCESRPSYLTSRTTPMTVGLAVIPKMPGRREMVRPNRIVGGKVKARGRFAQDHHGRSRPFVGVTEIPAGHKLRAEGSKIAGRGGVDSHEQPLFSVVRDEVNGHGDQCRAGR